MYYGRTQGARICLTLPGPDCATNADHIRECWGAFTALEFRLDRILGDLSNLVASITELTENTALMETLAPQCDKDFSLILTLRRKEDGGEFAESVAEGEILFLRLLEAMKLENAWPALQKILAVDVEQQSNMPSLLAAVKKAGIAHISSLHYLKNCPKNLMNILQSLSNHSDIPKLALMPEDLEDLAEVIEAGQNFASRFPNQPFILIAMGVYGLASRILPEKMASWMSFASPGTAVAPGQLACKALHERYRRVAISRSTAVFAIIGNPLGHSRSPEYHNNSFAKHNLNAVYLPLTCNKVTSIPHLASLVNMKGASVTIPHKETIRHILAGETEACTITGACNTIYRQANGEWWGENTDVEGFIRPIRSFIQESANKPLYATVIGAGGAARAAVYALLREGAKVLLLNRSPARAEKLAQHIHAYFPNKIRTAILQEESLPLIRKYKMLIVQTTALGLDNGLEDGSEDDSEDRLNADPLTFYDFDGSEFLYDIIYTPPLTNIMKRAVAAGCECKNGWEMFLAQAELQAEIFARCLKAD